MKNQKAIQSDTFYISQRIKEIDESYYIVYNFEKEKFEIHSSSQKGSTYCLTVPYNVLDERTLDLVRKTQSCNVDKIIEEIDKENEKKQRKIEKEAVDCLKEVIYDS